MEKDDLILVEECCLQYQVELQFVDSLNEAGLIHIVILEEKACIQKDELAELEKFIRLHKDLSINVEGIEVIADMMEKMKLMEKELESLKARLEVYEQLGAGAGTP